MEKHETDKVKAIIELGEKQLQHFERRHKLSTADLLKGVALHDKKPGSKGAIDPTEDTSLASWLVTRQMTEKLRELLLK